jgi:hypothetical protein
VWDRKELISSLNVVTSNHSGGSFCCLLGGKSTGKSIVLKNNYSGLHVAIFNGVPGITINYTIREKLLKKCENSKLKPLCGVLSSAISIVATHPLDTISTCIATRSPFKWCYIFNGFKHRFIEKNLTIGSKMLLLGHLNK